MSLRIRRGTDAQRAITSLDMGELVYTTDTKQLYVGNGIDAGGSPIIRLGTGLAWADPACTTIIATGAALQVSADPAPTLGGDLTLGGNSIIGTGNINIVGSLINIGEVTFGSKTIDSTITTYTRNSAYTIFNSLASNTQFVEMQVSNGTLTVPTAVVTQDILGGMILRGYIGSSIYERAVVIGGQADGAPISGGLPGKFIVYTTDAAGTGVNLLSFDKNGVLATPILKVANVSGTLPTSPEIGMIVLDGTIFKGYTSAGWVALNA